MAITNSLNITPTATTCVVGNGTGFSNVAYGAANTASTIMERDANKNSEVNNIIVTTDQVVSAAQTVVMTAASGAVQQITGTSTVTFRLPTATTLSLGTSYRFNNNSTGIVTVNRLNNTLVTTVLAGGYVQVNCTANSTGPGVWDYNYFLATGSLSGTLGTTLQGFIAANTIIPAYTTTATAAGTTTLTVASTQQQFFTGSSTQTVVLPVTSTLVLGQEYDIYNNSTGNVTVQSSGANTIQIMGPGTKLVATVILVSGTTAASWSAQYTLNSPGTTVQTVTSVAIGASPYTTVAIDSFIACQSSGGAITIRLPNAPQTGRTYIIKDSSGAAATSNITITTVSGAINIDGQTSVKIVSNYGSLNVIWDGATYQIY